MAVDGSISADSVVSVTVCLVMNMPMVSTRICVITELGIRVRVGTMVDIET